MPCLYFFAVDVHYYKKCFEYISDAKKKEIFEKMPNMHHYCGDSVETKLLANFLDEIKGIHLSNLNILGTHGLHTNLVPDARTTKYIFEEIEKRIVENDII